MWMYYVVMVLTTGELTTVGVQQFESQEACVAFLNSRQSRTHHTLNDLASRVILRGCGPINNQ